MKFQMFDRIHLVMKTVDMCIDCDGFIVGHEIYGACHGIAEYERFKFAPSDNIGWAWQFFLKNGEYCIFDNEEVEVSATFISHGTIDDLKKMWEPLVKADK